MVVLAIFVIFVYEYCFDNPSVRASPPRLWSSTSSTTTSTKTTSNWSSFRSICCMRFTPSPMSSSPSSAVPSSTASGHEWSLSSLACSAWLGNLFVRSEDSKDSSDSCWSDESSSVLEEKCYRAHRVPSYQTGSNPINFQ